MKEKIAKTNAARLLDKAKISYELIPYEVDENDLSAVHVAPGLEKKSKYLRLWYFTETKQAILSVLSPENMK